MTEDQIPPEERDEWEQHTPKGRKKLEAAWPKVMASNPRAYCRWNAQEDEDLRIGFYRRVPIGELARSHGRKYGAITSRLQKLGIDVEDTGGSGGSRQEAQPGSNQEQERSGTALDMPAGASAGSRPGGRAVAEPPDGTVWSNSRPGWFEHDDTALQRWQEQRPGVLEQYSRAHCPWSDAEDEQLVDAYENGAGIDVLSQFHRRQPSAIRSRLRTAIIELLGQRELDDDLVNEGLRSLDGHPPHVQQALREALGDQGTSGRAWQPWSTREDLILRYLSVDGLSQHEAAERLARSEPEVLARGALLDSGAINDGARDAGADWPEEDDADLLRLATTGYSGPTLAGWFGRTISAIAARLVRLHWTGRDDDSGGGGLDLAPSSDPAPTAPSGTSSEEPSSRDERARSATPAFDFGLLPQQHLHCPRPDCGEDLELEVVAEIDEGTAYVCNVCAARWIRLLRRACHRCGSEGVAHTAESWENRNYNPFVDFIEQRNDPKDYEKVTRRVWWCDTCHAPIN